VNVITIGPICFQARCRRLQDNQTPGFSCYILIFITAFVGTLYDKLYSPQMVVTIYKYTIENDLTKKREKKEKHKIVARTYLKQDM